VRPAISQTAFPGAAYRDYSRCLPDYLRDLAARAYSLRNREIAKLTTPEAIRARQRRVREIFWQLVGGMPERTPLNPRATGSFQRPGYRVEKIVYESRPNLHIPANLYIPTEGRPPFPGVLFQMGHSLNGKAADSYQRCCQALARLGYLVLAFDPMGQGERVYYPDASGTRTRLSSADDEHTVPGKQMLLVGDTSSRLQVWDAVRSLDYLASHPLVDPKRLGSTGQSGGGTLTMLLACVDDRLAAAVVSSGNTENVACANFNPPGSSDDAEQDFLGSGPLGFDRWDLLYPMAPKPLLVSVSDKDFFGTYSSEYISNGWEEYQKLKKVYEVLGGADRLAWADTPLPHGLSYDTRLHVYNWFARWLKNETKRIEEEPPTAPEPDKTLWVSETGNVVRWMGGETPFTLNKKRALVRQPAALDRLLGAERPAAGIRAAVLGRVPSRGLDIEAIEIPSAPRVWLPAWLFVPKTNDRSKPAFLALEPTGRNVRWHEGELYQSLAGQGYPVCSADVRGTGDLWPEFGRSAPRYARSHNEEEDYAWASLILGSPLLGQRVTDVLALTAALRAHSVVGGRPLVVAAMGKMTVPALFAGALDSKIDRLYLAGGLVSFQSILETEDYSHPFGNFVPNLLKHTDLPELVASIAPRKVVLAGSVGANGKPLDLEAVRKIYEKAPNVQVVAGSRWDAAALLSQTEG
jgi:dienelactone hydrolase